MSFAPRASHFDHTGAEYLRIEPAEFLEGGQQPIPLSLCEPLAYMTRGELQTMFPHGDPGRLLLSDVLFEAGDSDERPVKTRRTEAPFYLATTQVTNKQYEMFDPAHKQLRGKFGFSKEDDEAVIYVSWHEAVAYCEWLSKREGRPYRLPTETEWEFAARAGTTTLFSTGDTLPEFYVKNARVTNFTAPEDKVSLQVGQTPPNPWGLYEMHGNVEEWVEDWYAPHEGKPASGGAFKVTRGGSHGTFPYYLRSANRSAALPETRAFTIGFRVACGEPGERRRSVSMPSAPVAQHVKQRGREEIKRGPDSSVPYFKGPKQFVKIPDGSRGPLYSFHNHDTSLAECPNGDLLAIWYTCAREQGRELSVACSRLPFGTDEWEEAASFYDTPDRNDHCPALWFDGDQTLVHLNGTALSHYWEPLQIILRKSKDNGVTWSQPRYIAPDFGLRMMVAQPIVRLKNGWWIFGADANPQHSAMWLSKDQGETWEDTGGSINGIHAAIVELKDGRIMALGRGNNVETQLPMSITEDHGKTWTAYPTELPPITSTQRLSMTRLQGGALALATFLPDVAKLGPQKKTDRELAKLCICISYDDGKTWPVRRLLTDEKGDHGIIGMSNGRVYMGPGYSEPTGYVTITQARNGVIHVISSMNHYAFNLAWVQSGPAAPDPMPTPAKLAPKKALSVTLIDETIHPFRVGQNHWSNERTGAMEALDIARGFTAEAKFPLGRGDGDHFILRAFVRSGCTICNRYWLRVDREGAYYWYAGDWQKISGPPSTSALNTYRLAIRDDTCVQIYGEGKLLSTYPPSYQIGFAFPTRGNWLEWEIYEEGNDPRVEQIAFDLAGPFTPLS